MILSDVAIKECLSCPIEEGGIVIDPLVEDNIEPSSIDLRLGNEFIVFPERDDAPTVDTRNPKTFHNSITGNPRGRRVDSDDIVIKPGDFVLATTMERIELAADIEGEIKGRSSVGRLGVVVHKTAGLIDPGYRGEITLELTVDASHPVRLYSGQRVCQIVFHQLDQPAERPYGHEKSQYQGQEGVTRSNLNLD